MLDCQTGALYLQSALRSSDLEGQLLLPVTLLDTVRVTQLVKAGSLGGFILFFISPALGEKEALDIQALAFRRR